MSVTLGQSVSSLRVIRSLAQSSDRLAKVFEQLSSGLRINRASDDAAGLAVSSGLKANSRIFGQAIRNLSDGISVINIADQAIDTLGSIVQRQIELAQQAANGTLSTVQRETLDKEAQALRDEYFRILETTKFNDMSLLKPEKSSIDLQAGVGVDAVISIEMWKAEAEQIAFVQQLNMENGTIIANGYSQPAFLKHAGDDGKDTLLAVSVAVNPAAANRFLLLVQSYRTDSSGDLQLISQHQILSTHSVVIEPPVVQAEVAGNELRYRFRTFNGIAPVDSTRVVDIQGDGTLINPGAFGGAVAANQVNNINGNFSGLDPNEAVATGVAGTLAFSANLNKLTQGAGILELSEFSIASQGSALTSLDMLKQQLQTLATVRGRLGASQSRVETASRVLEAAREQSETAASRIMDVDVAGASSELVRLSILRDVSSAVLAQSNLQPQLALTLLGNIGAR